MIDLGEDLLIRPLSQVMERCGEELESFKRNLVVPTKPFHQVPAATRTTATDRASR